MNPFRVLGDLSHLTSVLILIRNIKTTKYIEGISFKTQTLYALVFITRYLDLLTFHWISLYNASMKIFFIVSTAYIVVLLQASKRTNTIAYNEMLMGDTFKIQHLLIWSAVMSLFFHHRFSFLELAWSFSVWLESVSILPQLYMLSKGGKTRSLTVHYIFAMGLYRALYIPNWIWRNRIEDKKLDKIAFFAGLLQALLYSDFFYIYYSKVIRGKDFKLPKYKKNSS